MVAGLEVAHIAFGKGAPAGEPRLDDIAGDRTRDGRKQVVGIEIADAGLGLHGEMICRAFGDDIDGAGDRIAAIERALRTLEHFYALDEIGRAHVCTPVTNAPLVCPLLLEKKK